MHRNEKVRKNVSTLIKSQIKLDVVYKVPSSCARTLCMLPHQTNKVVSICQRLHTSVVVFRSVRQTVRMEKICTTRAFVEFDGHFVTFFSRNNKCCYDIFITVVAKFHWPIAFKGSMCCCYRLTNVALEDSFPKS